MAKPSVSIATLRPELAASVREWGGDAQAQGAIASLCAPIVRVQAQSGIFGRIKAEEMLKPVKLDRAPGAEYHRTDLKFETDTFATVEYGQEQTVDDRRAVLYASFLDAEQAASQQISWALQRAYEKRVADLLFNAGTFSATALTNEWDDQVNATPIADLNASIKRVYNASGLVPNTLIINWKVFRNLLLVDEIVDRLKYNGVMDVGVLGMAQARSALAQAIGIDRILVGGMQRNTADEGQTKSLSPIWSDEYAMTAYIDDSGDPEAPTVARTFEYTEDGMQVAGVTFESYRDEPRRGTVIRGRHESDEKVIYVAAADLMSNVTT